MMISATELQLVKDLQAKSQSAFHQLYDAYSPALYGIILRLVHDKELAQDLLHDAFIKIWTNIDQFNPEKGKLFTWLVTLTRNLVFDELRELKQKQKFDNYLIQQVEVAHTPTFTDRLLDKSLLNNLRPPLRQVVELTYYKELTQQEIADHLSIPLGTVKTRIRTAMQKLHKLLIRDIHHFRLRAVHI
ncbi:sigma-70 family RNA polymerase sigma factor [Spirosoma daeguense]